MINLINSTYSDSLDVEYRHHAESTTIHKSTEDKITGRLDTIEKYSKKRSNELEKKIDSTNKKLSAQVLRISETEDTHYRDLKRLITKVKVQEQNHHQNIKERVKNLESIRIEQNEQRESFDSYKQDQMEKYASLEKLMDELGRSVPDTKS